MDKNLTHKILYNSPTWAVLIYIIEHPEQPVRGSHLVKALPKISKSAIYNAIRLLEKIDILVWDEMQKAYLLNRDSIGLHALMSFHNQTLFQPLVNGISDLSFKIILFGSRISGDYNEDSDYDLLIVTSHPKEVRQVVSRSRLAEQIQLILKTPEEWIDLNKQEPELYKSIQQGVILWERKKTLKNV